MREGGFPPGWMEELKSRNNIVEVISAYVELNRKGNRYFGCCPFHHEKTASFCVNEGDGYYHCFGCNASGDVVTFVQEYENKTFPEAVQILAERAGMEVPEFSGGGGKEKKKQRDIMFDITKSAAHFYNDCLFKKQEGKAVQQYLTKRGISGELAMKYGLGFSPDAVSLPKYLRLKAFPESLLKESGVLEGARLTDALAGRLIVPIINADGKVLGFGGRVIGDSQGKAKYKNTAATPLFDKGRTLYGLNFVKKEKQAGNLREIIVVEGYMDVIAMGKAGFFNAVAGMGTAFTPHQAREVKKWSTNIYLAYDGDNAGRKACLKSIDILTAEGLDVKVIAFPDGMDPDDAINKLGKEGFLKLLDNATDHVEYRLSLIEARNDLTTTTGRAAYLREGLAFLKKLQNLPEKEVYLQILNTKSGVSMNSLEKQLAKADDILPQEAPEQEGKEVPLVKSAHAAGAAEFCLNALLFLKPYAKLEDFKREWLSTEIQLAIFDYIAGAVEKGGRPVAGNVFDYVGDGEEVMEVLNLTSEFKSEIQAQKYYNDCVLKLANAYIEAEIKKLSQKHDVETIEDERKRILLKIMDLQRKLVSKNMADKL